MSTIQLKGATFNLSGSLPKTGDPLPNFSLVANDLSRVSLANYKGKKIILNIFPSIDTGTCAASVREFNKRASAITDTLVLCISRDLPFAMKRFCAAEGIENVLTLSDFETGKFGNDYGVTLANGPMAGLHARAIVLADSNGIIKHTQLVSELSHEPDYDAALNALKLC